MTNTSSFEVFISYAHEDAIWCEELKKALSPLRRRNIITHWYDRDISAGAEWEPEINKHLQAAKIILLLISGDFIASDYAYLKEMSLALKKHEDNTAIIIPVIVRACLWEDLPFGKLQCLPSNAIAITSWSNIDEAFSSVAKGIKDAIEKSIANNKVIHFDRPQTKTNLPSPPFGNLIGREEDIKRIMEGMELRFPVLAIEGFKGVGKTSLAIETGYRFYDSAYGKGVSNQIFEYVVWVSANDKPEQTNWLDEVLDEVAVIMGYRTIAQMPTDQIEQKSAEVRRLLYLTKVLLIIDNFEKIKDDELEKWLYRIPESCKVIITSRKDQLKSSFKIDLSGLDDKHALDFIRQTAYSLNLQQLKDEPDHLLLNLVRVTGGNPKAMEMALGNIRGGTLDLRNLIEQINSNNPTESMDEVFEYLHSEAWEGINDDSKKILLVVPLFTASSSINPAAMEAASGLGKAAFTNARAQLLDWKLLQISNSRASKIARIIVHPITREFIAKRLAKELNFEKEARMRLCDYYLEFVKKNILREEPAEEYWNALVTDKMDKIDEEEEWPVVDELLHWVCKEKMDELLMNFTMTLIHYLDSRYLNQERLYYVENAVKAAHKLGLKYKEALLRIDALGWTYVEENNFDKAYEEISEGIKLAREVVKETGNGEELIALGYAWWARAKIEENKEEEALEAIGKAMAYKDKSKHWIRFRILMAAGDIFLKQNQSDPKRALSSYIEAKEEMEEYGGEGNYYQINPRIGLAQLADNNVEEAEKVFNSLVKFQRISIGKLYGEYGIALVRFKQKKIPEASSLLNKVKHELSKKTTNNLLKKLIEDFEKLIVSYSVQPAEV